MTAVNEQDTTNETQAQKPAESAAKKVSPKAMIGTQLVRSVFDVFNGNILTNKSSLKQVPFLLFMTLVALLYIANGYFAERKIRQINKINNELKELRSEYITAKSKLMFVSKQSEVARMAETMGLTIKESTTPPNKIVLK